MDVFPRPAEPEHGAMSSLTERSAAGLALPGRTGTEKTLAHEPETETKTTATRARQGRRGFPILVVLVIGLVLAMGAWWVAEMYGVWIAPEDPVAGAEHTID